MSLRLLSTDADLETMIASGRRRLRPNLFWQTSECKPGDTFDHRGSEYQVDNVVAGPAGGFEVCAHPTLLERRE